MHTDDRNRLRLSHQGPYRVALVRFSGKTGLFAFSVSELMELSEPDPGKPGDCG